MTVPNDILRFEVLLYVSLLLDSLSAAFFGVGPVDAAGAASPSMSVFAAFFIAALVYLVWLAARRRRSWACWTLFGFFVLSVVLYAGSLSEMAFGVRTVIDVLSILSSAAGFYFAFTPEARLWFNSPNP